MFFTATGVQKGEMADQISRFVKEITRTFYHGTELKEQDNWFKTFDMLNEAIEKFVPKNKKIVLFFDEFPWMVTHRSKLLTVVEYFWNQHWSNNPKIKLIICGSSASWIIRKIINNKGGLHNRITRKMQLYPFNLKESKAFLLAQGIKLNNQQVLQLYMITGGVPYYLSLAEKGLSATQIIEQIAFQRNSLLFQEFDNLFFSLFEDEETYVELLRIIANHRYGIEQEAIIKLSKHSSRGGRASEKLKELEDTGFIASFVPHFNKKRGIYYRVIDEYTLFYLKWIEPVKNNLQKFSLESGYWENEQTTPAWASWAGYTFEAVCYKHLSQIRKKLKINPGAIASTWRYQPKPATKEDGAQIDLLFDRSDKAITLCEIKYTDNPYPLTKGGERHPRESGDPEILAKTLDSRFRGNDEMFFYPTIVSGYDNPFVINKDYAKKLISKREIFIKRTKTQKQIFFSLITSNGMKDNLYSDDIINGVVTLDDLFNDD